MSMFHVTGRSFPGIPAHFLAVVWAWDAGPDPLLPVYGLKCLDDSYSTIEVSRDGMTLAWWQSGILSVGTVDTGWLRELHSQGFVVGTYSDVPEVRFSKVYRIEFPLRIHTGVWLVFNCDASTLFIRYTPENATDTVITLWNRQTGALRYVVDFGAPCCEAPLLLNPHPTDPDSILGSVGPWDIMQTLWYCATPRNIPAFPTGISIWSENGKHLLTRKKNSIGVTATETGKQVTLSIQDQTLSLEMIASGQFRTPYDFAIVASFRKFAATPQGCWKRFWGLVHPLTPKRGSKLSKVWSTVTHFLGYPVMVTEIAPDSDYIDLVKPFRNQQLVTSNEARGFLLLRLPEEILFKIFELLLCKDLLILSGACKYLRRICSDDNLWKIVSTTESPMLYLSKAHPQNSSKGWKDMYTHMHREIHDNVMITLRGKGGFTCHKIPIKSIS